MNSEKKQTERESNVIKSMINNAREISTQKKSIDEKTVSKNHLNDNNQNKVKEIANFQGDSKKMAESNNQSSNGTLYDVIIIGGGPGGYHTALRGAQYGAKIAIVEKQYLGGTCSNFGCIPTKALYSSAKLYEDIKEKAEDFGIYVKDVEYDFSKAVDRKNRVVEDLRKGIEGLLNVRKVSIFRGFGKIIGGNKESGFTVSVESDGKTEEIKGKRVIIATGSEPALIPTFNIDHKKIITSDDVLAPDFKTLPKSILIIGAGVIGSEFAFIFKNFGVEKVIMLEFLPTMLATEEPRVVKALKAKCIKCGIELYTSQNVLKIEVIDDIVRATTCSATIPRDNIDGAEKFTYEADLCLVSIGRKKNVAGLGFEELGGKLERGAIVVDEQTMETTIPGIYAIGDVNNTGLMLAHVASYQGDIAMSQALNDIGGFPCHLRIASPNDVVPYTIFTSPEIGSVGLREKAAKQKLKEKGEKVYTGRFMYSALGKAKCMGEEDGFLMIICDKDDKILGASCIGAEAPELISEITVAMQHGLTAQDLCHTIHSHPTISEMVLEAAEDVRGLAIHKAGRPRLK